MFPINTRDLLFGYDWARWCLIYALAHTMLAVPANQHACNCVLHTLKDASKFVQQLQSESNFSYAMQPTLSHWIPLHCSRRCSAQLAPRLSSLISEPSQEDSQAARLLRACVRECMHVCALVSVNVCVPEKTEVVQGVRKLSSFTIEPQKIK